MTSPRSAYSIPMAISCARCDATAADDCVQAGRATIASCSSSIWRSGGVAGVVGCAVGAPYAVLVAEQLFASGCRFLISITSAGLITDLGDPPYVVLIERALRDEGTSAHYLPSSLGDFASAPDAPLLDRVESELRLEFPPGSSVALHRGATWTTDAPYRETEPAIAAARLSGALAVEMEAAALYAFATAKGVPVVCFRACHQYNGSARRRRFRERRRARDRDGPTSH